MIPCDGGDFVRFDEASRYFQWHTLNRVLALLQTFEANTLKRSDLYHAISEIRPENLEDLVKVYEARSS